MPEHGHGTTNGARGALDTLNLGVAGAAFAALLTIAQMGARDASLRVAVGLFAIGVPLAVSTYFLDLAREESAHHAFRTAVRWLGAIAYLVAQALCVAGFYYLVAYVSPVAARAFGYTIAGAYVTVSVLVAVAKHLPGPAALTQPGHLPSHPRPTPDHELSPGDTVAGAAQTRVAHPG